MALCLDAVFAVLALKWSLSDDTDSRFDEASLLVKEGSLPHRSQKTLASLAVYSTPPLCMTPSCGVVASGLSTVLGDECPALRSFDTRSQLRFGGSVVSKGELATRFRLALHFAMLCIPGIRVLPWHGRQVIPGWFGQGGMQSSWIWRMKGLVFSLWWIRNPPTLSSARLVY